jgi:hypothetical protein
MTRPGKGFHTSCFSSKNAQEASYPTVANEPVMLTSARNAAENCDVATPDMDEIFHIRDKWKNGWPTYWTNEPNKYSSYGTIKHNNRLIYVWLKKDVYGKLLAALLFGRKISSKVSGVGICHQSLQLVRS